jgi:hypothetical protein
MIPRPQVGLMVSQVFPQLDAETKLNDTPAHDVIEYVYFQSSCFVMSETAQDFPPRRPGFKPGWARGIL